MPFCKPSDPSFSSHPISETLAKRLKLKTTLKPHIKNPKHKTDTLKEKSCPQTRPHAASTAPLRIIVIPSVPSRPVTAGVYVSVPHLLPLSQCKDLLNKTKTAINFHHRLHHVRRPDESEAKLS